jgi:MFS family permease
VSRHRISPIPDWPERRRVRHPDRGCLDTRRLFVGAIVIFGAASAAGGVAAEGPVLLAARNAQGFGAALLQPAVLGLIGTTFPAGPARGRALAVWGSVGASGLAVGAILGGLLTTTSWRLTFFINVPLTLLCAVGAAVWFDRSRAPGRADRIGGNLAAGRAARRWRPATVLVAGFTVAAVGLGWLAATLPGDSYLADLLPGLVVSGFGHGVIYTSMFVIGTRDVAAEHQGTAGALLTTSQYLSAAVTVAVLTIVLGDSPGDGRFRAAFLVTAAAAVAGAALIAARHRQLDAGPAGHP